MRAFLEPLWSVAKLGLIFGLLALGSCSTARTILKQAPNDLPDGWVVQDYRPANDDVIRMRLQSEIYGDLAQPVEVEVEDVAVMDGVASEGRASITQWRLAIGFGGPSRPLDLVLVMPSDHPQAPIILSQNFCPNHSVVPFEGVRAPELDGFDCSGGGLFGLAMTNVFGRHIVVPPLEKILGRGYGFAAMYPSQFIPDRAEAGELVLEELFGATVSRPGALAAWSQLFDVAATAITEQIGPRSFV
ncbi:MAG: hypothetical protein AAF311_13615, partial [Pseudomonadota bacterium]